MSVPALTKNLENRRMLAALLGIEDEEAASRLEVTVLVTAADDAGSVRIANHVLSILGRTVNASSDDADIVIAEVEVIIGPAAARSAGTSLVWLGPVADGIRVATDPFRQVPATVHQIFEVLAACYACGMALRFALGRGLPFAGASTILISPAELLGEDLRCIDQACDMGEAVLAGAGAVGNAFLFGLKFFQIVGRLHIVDPKKVHDGILNRCIWFSSDDNGIAKALAIAARAQRSFSALELVPHVATVNEAASALGSNGLERLVTTVDSRRARRSLQDEIPREVFDASTTGVAEVVLHFNEQPSDLACLACIYRQEEGELKHEEHVAEALGVEVTDVQEGFISETAAARLCLTFSDLKAEEVVGKAYDTLFKARCAEGVLRTAEDRQVLAPFCFVSVLAGAYLALEFVRRVNSGRIAHPFNYWRVSPWHAPVVGLRALRGIAPGCRYCGEPVMRQTALSIWGHAVPEDVAGVPR